MSPQNHNDTIICPNCNSEAKGNYCYQCGQETHLHKDTFWGLVTHFTAHYFHYDSKFWKTLTTLWFKPGELTIAYNNKQRMRYLPPISLYIFVSAIFFLTASLGHHKDKSGHNNSSKHEKTAKSSSLIDSANKYPSARPTSGDVNTSVNLLSDAIDSINKYSDTSPTSTDETSSINLISDKTSDDSLKLNLKDGSIGGRYTIDEDNWFVEYLEKKDEKIKSEYGSLNNYLKEKLTHNVSKLFFFMIPILALIIKLFYLRRKNHLFVNHSIFALHVHSLFFSVFTIKNFIFDENIKKIASLILAAGSVVYLVFALHKVYQTSWIRSIIYTIFITLLYTFSLLLVFILTVFLFLII